MRLKYFFFAVALMLIVGNIWGQMGQIERLFIPFLDRESQSNVAVIVCDFSKGQPCPLEYTNTLSNTNLFTPEEQKTISEVFEKYKNTTTNSGPLGTILTDLHETNYIVGAMGRMFTNKIWVTRFQYTNFDAYEEIRFSGGMFAKYRNKSNGGYNVSFNRTGDGTLLSFGEVKQDLVNGVFVRFDDNHPQGTTWDYRLANFDGNHLEEYRRYTDKMVIGNFFMWNPRSGNLLLEADFKEPYDFEKHRIDLKISGSQK